MSDTGRPVKSLGLFVYEWKCSVSDRQPDRGQKLVGPAKWLVVEIKPFLVDMIAAKRRVQLLRALPLYCGCFPVTMQQQNYPLGADENGTIVRDTDELHSK